MCVSTCESNGEKAAPFITQPILLLVTGCPNSRAGVRIANKKEPLEQYRLGSTVLYVATAEVDHFGT